MGESRDLGKALMDEKARTLLGKGELKSWPWTLNFEFEYLNPFTGREVKVIDPGYINPYWSSLKKSQEEALELKILKEKGAFRDKPYSYHLIGTLNTSKPQTDLHTIFTPKEEGPYSRVWVVSHRCKSKLAGRPVFVDFLEGREEDTARIQDIETGEEDIVPSEFINFWEW